MRAGNASNGTSALGCLFIIGVMIWLLVECTSGGSGEKTNGLNTRTITVTYLAADYETFKRGQEVLMTGDSGRLASFMRSENVFTIEEGVNVYIHEISPLKGFARVSVRSGKYQGETGYVPSVALDKSSRPMDKQSEERETAEIKEEKVEPPLIRAIIDSDIAKVRELAKNMDASD